jgi:hypothetical protein
MEKDWSSQKLHFLQYMNIITLEHMFLICFWPVIDAWQKINTMWIAIGFILRPFIWEQITWGTLEPSIFFQNINNHYFSNIETPWELLQSKILWHT